MIPTNIHQEERKVFTETLDKIVEVVRPEKIICYGNRIDYHESWSSFLPMGCARYSAYYDILIITKEGDNRKDYEIFNLIDPLNKVPIHFTAIVRSIAAVNKAISQGSQFFVTMYHKGMMVYDDHTAPLVIPDAELNERKLARLAESEWDRLFTLAKKYQTLAGMCVPLPNDYLHSMSVFMLHQSMEVACRAIIRYYTGYRTETHDLRRLLWLMRNFTLEGELIFPRGTNEEMELFEALYSAYDDVRHGNDYKIPIEIIKALRPRVGKLMGIVEKLYQEKRNSLERHPAWLRHKNEK